MIYIRTISHILILGLCMQAGNAHAASFWDAVSGWFHNQTHHAERAAQQMVDSAEQVAQKVESRVHEAAQKAKKNVEKNADQAADVADQFVEPVVKRVQAHVKRGIKPVIKGGVKHIEKHAKPAIQRAIKNAVEEAEKQAQPIIDRTEKRIQHNIARIVSAYMLAGLGGIVGFMAARKSVTCMTQDNPGTVGGWLHRQDVSSSALVSDVIIGAMLGMGTYGLWQTQINLEEANQSK
jgi:vacuolar-type H+-ATPase subunit H